MELWIEGQLGPNAQLHRPQFPGDGQTTGKVQGGAFRADSEGGTNTEVKGRERDFAKTAQEQPERPRLQEGQEGVGFTWDQTQREQALCPAEY